jgi:hypothetical protein
VVGGGDDSRGRLFERDASAVDIFGDGFIDSTGLSAVLRVDEHRISYLKL